MKAKIILTTLLLIAIAAPVLLLTGCAPGDHAHTAADNVDYYTCTMHPSVRKLDPKEKCPICKMDLVPVMKKSNGQASAPGPAGHDHSAHSHGQPGAATTPPTSEFVVPVHRQQQIGVTYATITEQSLRQPIRAVGRVTYDTQRHWDFVSRVEGYVQDLQISSGGELVEKDQPLLTIYSPELLTTQREFLDLVRMRNRAKESGSTVAQESAERLLAAARRRLLLWNITENQIRDLEQTQEAQDTITLFSPFKGIVQNLRASQGQRVMLGDHLVDVADLSVVWVWADFYQDELPLLQEGMPVKITTDSYPGKTFEGKIVVIDPFLNQTTRTGRVRIDVENPELKLRPDMYVDVNVEADLGQALVIPVQAVMPTGERNVVFVDQGEGKLEPRFVQLGRPAGGFYPIQSGLEAGDRVVASANFLIDAEAKVQGALRTW